MPKRKSKGVMPVFEAHGRAIEALKSIGFQLRAVSQKSEACYFALPGRSAVLRVATHRYKKSAIGLGPVVATLTFTDRGQRMPGHIRLSEVAFENRLYLAVGQYLFRCQNPPPSRYKGKRGTWEQPTSMENAECPNSPQV